MFNIIDAQCNHEVYSVVYCVLRYTGSCLVCPHVSIQYVYVCMLYVITECLYVILLEV